MEGPSHSEVNLENPLVYLEWEENHTTLPVGMQHAQAVVVGNKVYVGGGMTTGSKSDSNIYVFDHTIERPTVTSIPTPGPTRWSTLTSFHSQLVLAGGTIDSVNATDKLWVLRDDGYMHTWDQPFPAMPQACWGASAVSSGDHLLIAGGVGSDHPLTPLDTVQIYNASSKKWVLSKPLPSSCYFMKSFPFDGDWYLAGGRWQYSKVFHASLESLIGMSREEKIWESLPELSQRRCCSISVCCNQLIAVGGMTISGPTREIQVYSTKKREWIEAENVPHICDSVCTIILPNGEMLLIGGNTGYLNHDFCNSVTKARTKVIRSLDDKFSQSALKHIERVTGKYLSHTFACGLMHSRDGLFQEDESSENTHAITWRILLQRLRDRRMYDVAQDIERLFNNKAALVHESLSSGQETVPLAAGSNCPIPGKDSGTPQFKRTPTKFNEEVHDTKGVVSKFAARHALYLYVYRLEREYDLKEELGRGGFGVVYHVKNKFDRGHYALKITKLPKSKHQQDKVMREVHALVTLDHPRILRYYTSWSERVRDTKVLEAIESQKNSTVVPDSHPDDEGSSKQELPYCLHIQTQLCNKDTLKDWLKTNIDNRQKKTVFGFFEQIHDAVVYIHQKGLLHRDLKPSNVFFSREGGSVKVGDFGLVAGVNVDNDTTHGTLSTEHEGQQVLKQTHSGHVGTRLYMAPEQLKEDYDKKVDIYALGVIFFELNCPFPTDSEGQRQHVLMNLHSRQKLPSWFSTKLSHQAELIELLLASDPKIYLKVIISRH